MFMRCTHTDDEAVRTKLKRLCAASDVKTRYMVLTEEMLKENPNFIVDGTSTIRDRLRISGDALTKLGTIAAKRAFKEWGRTGDSITHMVYVSSTENRMPGGDHHVAVNLGLSNKIHRVKLYMLGCNGGVAGMRVAKELAENNPGARVLLVTCDTTVVGFRKPTRERPEEMMWQALFGDGAAAVIIGGDPLPKESAYFELVWGVQSVSPGTEEVIEGTISEEGTLYKIGRELPKLLEADIDNFARLLLNKVNSSRSSSKHANGGPNGSTENGGSKEELTYNDLFWAVHPGGPTIVHAVQNGLELPPKKFVYSWQVLRDYGNIVSNSVMYIMDTMRNHITKRRELEVNGVDVPEDPEWGVMIAFGPGLTSDGIVARNLM